MFGAILKATNGSFQKGMIFGRSIYAKKVMKLLAFIFEQPSYTTTKNCLLPMLLYPVNQFCTVFIKCFPSFHVL